MKNYHKRCHDSSSAFCVVKSNKYYLYSEKLFINCVNIFCFQANAAIPMCESEADPKGQ